MSQNGDLTLNGPSDETAGFSSDVLTMSPSSLEDEGVGKAFMSGSSVAGIAVVDLLTNVNAVTTSKPAAAKMDTPPRSDTKDGCFRSSREGPQGFALIADGPRWASVAGGAIRWKMSLSRFQRMNEKVGDSSFW